MTNCFRPFFFLFFVASKLDHSVICRRDLGKNSGKGCGDYVCHFTCTCTYFFTFYYLRNSSHFLSIGLFCIYMYMLLIYVSPKCGHFVRVLKRSVVWYLGALTGLSVGASLRFQHRKVRCMKILSTNKCKMCREDTSEI